MAHVSFTDGPAEGIVRHFDRVPIFLRVVRCPANNGDPESWDVLDQLDDEPTAKEEVHVYRRTQYGFACRGGPGEYATYEYFPAIAGEEVRQTEEWQRRVEALAEPV